jgi:hypothetical protein
VTALEREWAAKLKATGFQDLECPDGSLSNRGKPHPTDAAGDARGEDLAAYNEWARGVLWSRRWANETDRAIWEAHCDGASVRDTIAMGHSQRRIMRVLGEVQATRQKPRKEVQWQSVDRQQRRALKRAPLSLVEKLARALLTRMPSSRQG